MHRSAGNGSRRRRLALMILVAVVVPASAFAQVVSNLERKLLPFQLGPLAGVPRTFWDGLTFLRDEEDRQRSLKAEINFGLSGDEAGERSLFKLNTGIALSHGTYPSELSVVSRLLLQLRDGQLQEDVTSLQITYDYHTARNLQYFTFAERFTDSFMSIQQRYEIGFGARVGAQWGRVGNWRATEAGFAAVAAGLPAVEAALPTLRAGLPAGAASPLSVQEVTAADLDAFRLAMQHLRYSVEDRQGRLLVGLAASLFSEIESAALDAVSLPVNGSGVTSGDPIRTRVTIGTTQRYRISVRPTLRVRPTPEIQVSVFPYFKLPLDGPRHVTVADGSRRLDYRRDILSELSWNIRTEQTGLENVEFVVTYNHYFDNVPPALPEPVVAESRAAGRVFTTTTAEHSHQYVALALRLRW